MVYVFQPAVEVAGSRPKGSGKGAMLKGGDVFYP
jgi:hypothetical protein